MSDPTISDDQFDEAAARHEALGKAAGVNRALNRVAESLSNAGDKVYTGLFSGNRDKTAMSDALRTPFEPAANSMPKIYRGPVHFVGAERYMPDPPREVEAHEEFSDWGHFGPTQSSATRVIAAKGDGPGVSNLGNLNPAQQIISEGPQFSDYVGMRDAYKPSPAPYTNYGDMESHSVRSDTPTGPPDAPKTTRPGYRNFRGANYGNAWQNRPQVVRNPNDGARWMDALLASRRVNVGGIDLGAEDDSDLTDTPEWMRESFRRFGLE